MSSPPQYWPATAESSSRVWAKSIHVDLNALAAWSSPLRLWPSKLCSWMLGLLPSTSSETHDAVNSSVLPKPVVEITAEIGMALNVGPYSVATTLGLGITTYGNLRRLFAAHKPSPVSGLATLDEAPPVEDAVTLEVVHAPTLATPLQDNALTQHEPEPLSQDDTISELFPQDDATGTFCFAGFQTATTPEENIVMYEPIEPIALCEPFGHNDATNAFCFAGLHAATPMADPQLAELALANGAPWTTWDDATAGILDLDDSSEEDSDRSLSPLAIFDEDKSFLDLHDSASSSSSDGPSTRSEGEDCVDCGHDVYSLAGSQAAVESSHPETWSRVNRISSFTTITTSVASLAGFNMRGGSSCSADTPYTPGTEPNESATLRRAHTFYFLRFRVGQGSFGRVYMANDWQGNTRAVKVVHKDKQYRLDGGRDALVNEKRTLQMISAMKMPFVTPLIDSWADAQNVYFVMPYYRQTLLDLMLRRLLLPSEMVLYIAELASGLASLHAAGIIHRDLKPENILIDASGHLAIADLGLAYALTPAELRDPDTAYLTGPVGTLGYMAPEVFFSGRPYGRPESRRYNYKCDVWSFGALVLDMVLGKQFFFLQGKGKGREAEFVWQKEVPYDEIDDLDLRELVQRMLKIKPDERPTAQEIKESSYLRHIDWKSLESGNMPIPTDRLTPPLRCPIERKATIGFRSFHAGLDSTMSPSQRQHLDDDYQLVPTSLVAQQHEVDQKHPFDYEYMPWLGLLQMLTRVPPEAA